MLFLLVLPLLGAGIASWSYKQFCTSPLFRVEAVQVERCSQVSPQEVSNSLSLEPNANILLLDLSELAGRARRNPWVQEASIRRLLPHTLLVKVVERRPAGVLLGGDPFLVSEDGMILASLKGQDSPKLPLIRLEGERSFQVGDTVRSAMFQRDCYLWRGFSQFLKGAGGQIREIYETKDGSLQVKLDQGMPSLKLRPESLEEQFARMGKVFSRHSIDWASVEYVDLRFSGRVILKPTGKGGEGLGKG